MPRVVPITVPVPKRFRGIVRGIICGRCRIKCILSVNIGLIPILFAELLHAAKSHKAPPKFRAHYVVKNRIYRGINVKHDSGKVQYVIETLDS